MLLNLSAELVRAKIPKKVVAETLGCTMRTLENKLQEKTVFSIKEAFVINDTFFPTMKIPYLFATDSEHTQ